MNFQLHTIDQPGQNLDDIIDFERVKRAGNLFRAVSNVQFRRPLIKLLLEKGPLNVTEIYCELNWLQSVASQQLTILRNEGLVKHERKGKHFYYTLNLERFQVLKEVTDKILENEK